MNCKDIKDFIKYSNYKSIFQFENDPFIKNMNLNLVARKALGYTEDDELIVTHIYKCDDGFIGITGVNVTCDYDLSKYDSLIAEEYSEVVKIDYVKSEKTS